MKRKEGNPLIRVQDLTKTFVTGERQDRKLYVLRGINLSVYRGEVLAVVGASGAGKSTLLHIMGTLDRPTTGTAFYEDVDVFAMSDEDLARFRNERVGFVFQFHHLLPEFTAFENVAMPSLIRGGTLASAKRRVTELLEIVGLADKTDSKPAQLSGGEQQRVAVARALVNSPQVVLADEPSGNLDTENAGRLHELIRSLSAGLQQTFVVVTHNTELARSADRIVKIQDGVIQSAGR